MLRVPDKRVKDPEVDLPTCLGDQEQEDEVELKASQSKQTNVDDPGYIEGVTDFSKDENVERGNWTGKADFILACLGYAVGLGNVWRFPYLCYENGGAIFFIPYTLMLFFVGMPIFFLELSLGQFTSCGPTTCWRMAGFFKGIGVAMVIVSAWVAIYYVMIIAWAVWYLFASLIHVADLPWQYCNGDYNTEFCSALLHPVNKTSCLAMEFNAAANGVCYNKTANQSVPYGIWNGTAAKENNIKAITPSEEYYHGRAMGDIYATDRIDGIGPPRWELVLSLIVSWLIVYFSLIKGIKSSGKVVYFTALFPYVVLIILLCRGATLEGHLKGIEFYIANIEIAKLSEAKVWAAAASQIFFSLSASWGGLIALASYNRFHNDCLRDSLIVSLGNCLTSFFAGFVIFSFLGYLAHELDSEVSDVVDSGVGLAFIVYPDAVTRMPASGLWSVLFFIMLITLGLDSEFALVETVSTSVMDEIKPLREKKVLTLGVLCLIMFILGLPLTCNGGVYVLTLIDSRAGSWNVLVIALCECIAVAWVYHFNGGRVLSGKIRFMEDIRVMLGANANKNCWNWDCFSWWWATCWFFLTPISVLFVLIFSWSDYSPIAYGKDDLYPQWAQALGICLTMSVLMGIIVTGIVLIVQQVRSKQPIGDLFRPDREWGPALVQHRRLVLRYVPEDTFEVDPWAGEGSEFTKMRPHTAAVDDRPNPPSSTTAVDDRPNPPSSTTAVDDGPNPPSSSAAVDDGPNPPSSSAAVDDGPNPPSSSNV